MVVLRFFIFEKFHDNSVFCHFTSVQARVLGIEVIREEGNICEDLDLSCPLPIGRIDINVRRVLFGRCF